MEVVKKPIWRKVKDEITGKVLNLVLPDFCWCNKCNRVARCQYSPENPLDEEYWECEECGNTDLELNDWEGEKQNENN